MTSTHLLTLHSLDKHRGSRHSAEFSSTRLGGLKELTCLQLALEWATLSKYTGNKTYEDLALRSLRHIANLVRFSTCFKA